MWELRERMRYKDSDRELSPAGLVMIRLQGVALIVVAALIAAVKLRWGAFE